MKQRSIKMAKEVLPIIRQLKTSRTKSFIRQERNLSVFLLSLWDFFSRPLLDTCLLEQHLFLEVYCTMSSVLGSHIKDMDEWLLLLAKEKLQHNIKQKYLVKGWPSLLLLLFLTWRWGGPASQCKEFSELGKYWLQSFGGVSLVALNACETPKEGVDI